MCFAVWKLGVDVVDHLEHHTSHHFFLFPISGPVHLVAEVATAFVRQAESHDETLHRRNQVGVIREDLEVDVSLALAAAGSAFAALVLGEHHESSQSRNSNHQEDFAHGLIILSLLDKARVGPWIINGS